MSYAIHAKITSKSDWELIATARTQEQLSEQLSQWMTAYKSQGYKYVTYKIETYPKEDTK